MKTFRRIFIIIIAASLCACSDDVVEHSVQSFETAVPEPSDLCLSFAGNSLLAVSDQGLIYEIGFDGKTIRRFDQYVNPDPSQKDDLEGICIDPLNKNIFVVNERSLRISRLDEDGRYLDSFIIPASVLKPDTENHGIEGITLYSDIFYFVNQKKPCALLSYNRVTHEWSSLIPLNFCSDANAVSYDASDNSLWIVSSSSLKLFQCSTAGKPLKVLNIPFINKPEGVWVDRDKNVAYLCCDQTRKLYKVSLNKLINYE